MKKILEKIVAETAQKLFEIDPVGYVVEYPKDEKFGDYATNIALVLAKKVGKSPMEVAVIFKEELDLEACEASPFMAKIEVVAPGYINFHLSKKYLQDKIEEINEKKESFGDSKIGKGVKVNNEFISANPTGPLTVGNGRGGFCGDSISRVLRKNGFEVVSEYYINDAGGQIMKLGHSVLKDEEAAYSGEYIDALNKKYGAMDDVQEIGRLAAKEVLDDIIKKIVEDEMKIHFDEWMSEQKLKDDKYDERAIKILQEKGFTYESEGAIWIKTTAFGDDKDRVLIKSDGKNAYIAGDCGYMLNKMERGFGRLIMGLGADHHGYVSRLRAAAKALGFDGDFRFIISQLVRITKDGKEARMSKRAGNVVEISELIEKVGHDVTRFFFLMYSPDTHMNFDLGLAEEKSQKNPVFYVQYAHARICSILRKAEETRNKMQDMNNGEYLDLLVHEKELSLIKELNRFPELVEEIGKTYEVHKLPYYAIKLADKFHSFYNACKVIDEENLGLTKARIRLITAVRIVLGETLNLIGVEAPEKM
jgi:arginyl-tRNA synthetase